MAQWITVAEVQAIIGLNESHDENVDFQQYILRAQLMDVKQLLGERLYADIDGDQTKTANGSYPNLLDGGNYAVGGYTYLNEGLNKVLAYYAAYHYRFDGQEVDTPYGFAEVEAQYIRKSSRERNREMALYYRELANKCWESVRDYLQRKSNDYTLWFGQPSPDWDRTTKPITIQQVTLK